MVAVAPPAQGRTDLLVTKVAVPVLRPGVVARPRLLKALDAVLHQRLVLVSAPAGFGKTTLLVQWLADRRRRQELRVGWLALEPADNDPARFCRYLLAAALPLLGEDGGPIRALLAQRHIAPAAVTGALVNALAARHEDLVLVLDDYHVLTEPAAHGVVAALLDHLPPPAHMVLLGRADPPLPLARLRARGELLEVRADGLRFSTDEAGAFFVETMGLRLDEAEVASLTERTEGWAAGLQLAGLSLQGRSDARAFIAAFSGSHRFVLDYLLEEVLQRQPPDVQCFLLQTAVLDRLSAELCAAVTGHAGAQALLEHLERSNLFVVPLDDERRWYRYHHLFAELLQAELRRRAPETVAELHRRAAAWLEQHGATDAAIRHALAAGDVQSAAALVERHWLSTELVAGEFDTALRWLDALPDAVVRGNAVLSVAYAAALTLRGPSAGVEARLADAEVALAAEEQQAVGSEGAVLLRGMPALVALLRSILARTGGDATGALAFARRGLALLPPDLQRQLDGVLRGGAWSLIAQAHDAAGEHESAAAAYREALPLLRVGGNAIGLSDTVYHLACLAVRAGQPAAAVRLCEDGLREAAGAGLDGAPSSARLHLGLAEALLATGDRAGAQEHAERGLALARLGDYGPAFELCRELLDRIGAAAGMVPPRTAAGAPADAQSVNRSALVEPLTEREREVLALVDAGRSNREIAAELVISLSTAKSHVHTLCGKLGAQSRTHALARARELGLLH